jgi:tyrosyl-tRNA synthetase
MYQFWLNVEDADVVGLLRRFTLLAPEQVDALAAETHEQPQLRGAQKVLAADVTRRVHGEGALAAAQRASDALFGGDLHGLSADQIAEVFADVPSAQLARAELSGAGMAVVDLLVQAGVASSKSDARRSLEGGGIYLNNVRVSDSVRTVTLDDALEGRFLVLRKGKKSYTLVAVSG